MKEQNFTNKRHNNQFSKFFLKDKISYNFLKHFLIHVKSVSTITLHFSRIVNVSVLKDLQKKSLIYIYKVIRDWMRSLRCSDFLEYWRGLFKYNFNKINMLDMKLEDEKWIYV